MTAVLERMTGRDPAIWRKLVWSIAVLVMLVPVTAQLTLTEMAWDGFDFAVFGAMLLAMKERRLSRAVLWQSLGRSVRTTCMIAAIILGAHMFGYFFTISQAPQTIMKAIGALEVSPWVIITLVIAVYLVLGCFLDQVTIIILTVPVVLPVIVAMGYSPIWFGVIVVVTAEVGMVTPPVGLNVFVVSRYTRQPAGEIFAGVMPHVVAHIILIALLVAFPEIIMFLPSRMS